MLFYGFILYVGPNLGLSGHILLQEQLLLRRAHRVLPKWWHRGRGLRSAAATGLNDVY